jgi:hypothetical protein
MINLPKGIYKHKSLSEAIKRKLSEAHLGKILSDSTKKRISKALKGKPSNMLGKHHTEYTKKKISMALKGHPVSGKLKEKLREISLNMSEEAKIRMRDAKIGGTLSREHKAKIGDSLKGRIPKNLYYSLSGNQPFGNVERGHYNINGKEMFFRSRWEANYGLYLTFLVKQKQIIKWEYEPDVFIFDKIKFGTRSYRPDFKIYNKDLTIEYHEVKGYMTPRSKTQIKRMAKYYPKIKLIIIDKEAYREIKRKLGRMSNFY